MRRIAIALAVLCTAGVAGAATSDVSGLDTYYAKSSGQGDAYEIQAGHLALSRGHSRAVKVLAHRLIADHSKSLSDLRDTASKLGIRLEPSPTPTQQWELSVLRTMHGKKFDQWFSRLEVKDHQQDISDANDELSMGTSPDVKKLAQDDLPVLRLHLRLAERAER